MNALACSGLLILCQDPSVERIMTDFGERMELARKPADERAAAQKSFDALEAYRKDHPKADDVARAEFHSAEMLALLDRPEDASKRFLEFHRDRVDDPNRATALFTAAGLLESSDRYDDARKSYEVFSQEHGDDPRSRQARLRAAMCRLYADASDEAFKALHLQVAFESREQGSWEARMALALAEHVGEKHEDAVEGLKAIAEKCPDRAVVRQTERLLDDYRRVGEPAPNLVIGDFKLADLKGKPVVLYLFSAHAEGAAAEAAALRRVAAKVKDVAIVGVCVDGLPESFARYREAFEPSWTIVHDPGGEACRKILGTAQSPFVLVIDRKGIVRFLHLSGSDLVAAARKLADEK